MNKRENFDSRGDCNSIFENLIVTFSIIIKMKIGEATMNALTP